MENAVKAMYIAGATMIALLVLSALIYMFRNGARLGQGYEQIQMNTQIVKFNSQFDSYAKITNQLTSSAYGYSFIVKGSTASDIITCANLAISVNEQNDFDEVNSIQVIVVCGGDKYAVYPIPNQPKNKFIKNKSLSESRTRTNFNDDEVLDFNEFLKMYNNVRIVDIVSDRFTSVGESIYEYYFDVDKDENGSNPGQGITYSEVTGKANKIVFTRVKTQHFDNTEYWK